MSKKKMWLAGMIHPKPHVTIMDWKGEKHESPVALPKDCVGVMYVFRTKTAARRWSGRGVSLVEMQNVDEIGT